MRFGLEETTIAKITKIFNSFPEVEAVIIYGSRAKGSHHTGSDIDLTLKGPNLNLQIVNQIRDQLFLMNEPYTFDLSIYHQIENKDLLDHIGRIGEQLL